MKLKSCWGSFCKAIVTLQEWKKKMNIENKFRKNVIFKMLNEETQLMTQACIYNKSKKSKKLQLQLQMIQSSRLSKIVSQYFSLCQNFFRLKWHLKRVFWIRKPVADLCETISSHKQITRLTTTLGEALISIFEQTQFEPILATNDSVTLETYKTEYLENILSIYTQVSVMQEFDRKLKHRK